MLCYACMGFLEVARAESNAQLLNLRRLSMAAWTFACSSTDAL